MYRVWDNNKNQYWGKSDGNYEELVMHPNGDLEILNHWGNELFEHKTQTRFKVEKYFCNLDGIDYYEGDVVVVINILDSSVPYEASIVWDNYRFAFQAIDIEIDYAYPLMDSSTFGINLRLVGNINTYNEEEDED